MGKTPYPHSDNDRWRMGAHACCHISGSISISNPILRSPFTAYGSSDGPDLPFAPPLSLSTLCFFSFQQWNWNEMKWWKDSFVQVYYHSPSPPSISLSCLRFCPGRLLVGGPSYSLYLWGCCLVRCRKIAAHENFCHAVSSYSCLETRARPPLSLYLCLCLCLSCFWGSGPFISC